MNYAKLENSPRLQRLKAYLEAAQGDWRSSMECITGAGVAAISSAVSELRRNGVTVDAEPKGKVWHYRIPWIDPAKGYAA